MCFEYVLVEQNAVSYEKRQALGKNRGGGATMPTKTVELVSNCYVVLIPCKNDKRIRAVN